MRRLDGSSDFDEDEIDISLSEDESLPNRRFGSVQSKYRVHFHAE